MLGTAAMPVNADKLDTWLMSEARQELIAAFESGSCRLSLTEVSDILFEYDASEESIYLERLITMEPETEPFVFPVVLAKGPTCEAVDPVAIVLPAGSFEYAVTELDKRACRMNLAELEALVYPAGIDQKLSDSDRRNVVSELYNRGEIIFKYTTVNGVQALYAQKITGSCKDSSEQ